MVGTKAGESWIRREWEVGSGDNELQNLLLVSKEFKRRAATGAGWRRESECFKDGGHAGHAGSLKMT